jgi:hypothetical protein
LIALNDAGGLAPLFLRTDPSPGTGATLVDGAAVQKALDLVRQVYSETLPRFRSSVDEITAKTQLLRPESIASAKDLADLLQAVQRTLQHYSPQVYQQDLDSLVCALAPGRSGRILGILHERRIPSRTGYGACLERWENCLT